jgi:hypothetical protein
MQRRRLKDRRVAIAGDDLSTRKPRDEKLLALEWQILLVL